MGECQGNRILFMVQRVWLAIKEKPEFYRFQVPAYEGTTVDFLMGMQ